jgi:DNA-binding MarR family transcriptional regulator
MARRRSRGIEDDLRQRHPFETTAAAAAVALLHTADTVRRTITRSLAAHGLTIPQYNVLRILRGAGPSGLATLEVADRMIEEAPGITRLVGTLERKGLLERERCLEDRRIVWCRITRHGLARLVELDAPMLAAAEDAMAGLGPGEQKALLGLLDRVRRPGAAEGAV